MRGTTRFDVQRSGAGSRVRVRHVGEADELPVPVVLVAGPLKAAMAADLERLKTIVETNARPQAGSPAGSGRPATPWHENE